jgi:hypothetical protein
MKVNRVKLFCLIVILFSLCTTASADLKVTTKTGVGGYNTQSVTYIKGARQRMEQGSGSAMIYQCDLKRIIQLNDNSRTFMIMPLDEQGETAEANNNEPEQKQTVKTRRGGVVTFTITTTDTGERKEMFGFTARHIKTVMTKDATANACDPTKMHIETDGWYIDLQYGLYCSSDKPVVPRQPTTIKPDCVDEVRYKQVGGGKAGYPLILTTTIFGDDNRQFTTTMEVTDFSTGTLDASLFEHPSNYREVKSFQELAGVPSGPSILDRNQPANNDEGDDEETAEPTEAKRAGVIRIGVVSLNNKTGKQVSTVSLRDGLIGRIHDSSIEAVALDGRSTSEIDAEAGRKGCDYILYTDITDLKKPSTASRIGGGILGRAGGSLKEKYEARVEFRLLPTGKPSPLLSSNVTTKEEGDENSTLSSALEKEASAVVSEVRKKR